MKSDVLREKFLSFFKAKGHRIVQSDSLVPKDDPTVLFTPAGMNQFKKEFLGHLSGFKRAATAQRCLRTDDLYKVGETSGHHTFFEMLGNFSFGDYFKQEAIFWAWEFLTRVLKIDPRKLWVSVYQEDTEAYDIWKDKINVPANKIVKLGPKENFWPANAVLDGPNGPCGPCSEIFFDFGADAGCRRTDCNPSCGCGRFVEIWNLVFTQFNRKDDGTLEPLPNKNIDTGMGLERLAAVMQGADNNFETDLFKPIINEIAVHSPQSTVHKELVYAIADHIRAVVFAVYDGILPSNEGRGYVVRKIIRKSILHLKALGLEQAFLYKLVPQVCTIMRQPYPELEAQRDEIAGIVLAEEKNFISTLANSQDLFREKFSRFEKHADPAEVGRVAFQLYDTYGIPLEVAKDWLDKTGIELSTEAFDREMDKQKTRSKLKSSMKGDVFSAQDSGAGLAQTKFSGYKALTGKAKVVRLIKGTAQVKSILKGDSAEMILDATSFYPEGGGQSADTGVITKGKNIFEVTGVKKSGRVIVHTGTVKSGGFKIAQAVAPSVDAGRRISIARNHTATHLLQAALRQVLGPHVRQQGSLVEAEKFRFDFSHFKALTKEELARVEEIVYGFILSGKKVTAKQMTQAQAKKIGALAFFGEKYGTRVRVVSVESISRELCGGTHLSSTGQAGYFKILREGSVASGVRRIEAATGIYARKAVEAEFEALENEAERLRQRLKETEKQKEIKKGGSLEDCVANLLNKVEKINGINLIVSLEAACDMNGLRTCVDRLKQKIDNALICLGASQPGKAFLVIGITQELCAKGMDAAKLIAQVSGIIGGSGGGRSDFAQAGGGKPENLEQALAQIKKIAGELK